MSVPPLVVVAATTVVAVGLTRPSLRRLPRPEGAPDYATLGTRGFLIAVGVITAVGSTLVTTLLPPAHQAPWLALTACGALAVSIDAWTTWLPRAVTLTGLLLIGAGVIITAAWESSATPLIHAGLGAVAVGGFFHGVWWLTGQLGYGDVRLMVLIGGVCALEGLEFVGSSVFCGSVVGAIWAVVHRIRSGGADPFPYGPALFSGPYLTLGLQGLLS
ncbi:MAG: hypothetical protein ACK5LS_01275 [Propioniciclava sp.]